MKIGSMNKIEKIDNYEEQLEVMNQKASNIAEEFTRNKVSYAEWKYKHMKLLAQLIAYYKEFKKNIGVDMAVLFALEDKTLTPQEREDFDKAYKSFLYYKALSQGLEIQVKALQSQISSLQSVLKYNLAGEIRGV